MSGSAITPGDLALVERLSVPAGIAPERAAALGRRMSLAPEERAGAPYVLLLGAPEAVRAIVLAAAGPEVERRMRELKAPVVVVGNRPDSIRPLVASWPQIVAPGLGQAGVIVLAAGEPIPAATLAALASLGTIEVGVLASRISQPLNEPECALAASLVGIVETMRAAFVVQRGEELGEADAAELHAYGKARLAASGYSGARFRECRILAPAGAGDAIAGASAPAQILDPGQGHGGGPRDAAFAATLAGLAAEIETRLAERPEAAGIAATPEDLARLSAQLDGHLRGLEDQLATLVRAGDIRDDATARRFLIDRVEGWQSGDGLVAHTVSLAERFRPGAASVIVKAVREAAPGLSVVPQARTPAAPSAERTAVVTFLARTHWARAIAAVSVGAISGFIASIVLPAFPADTWLAHLAAPATGALVGLALYIVLGQPWLIGIGPRPAGTPAAPPPEPLAGWPVVAGRIAASFAAHLGDDGGRSQLAALADLRSRLAAEGRSAS